MNNRNKMSALIIIVLLIGAVLIGTYTPNERYVITYTAYYPNCVIFDTDTTIMAEDNYDLLSKLSKSVVLKPDSVVVTNSVIVR